MLLLFAHLAGQCAYVDGLLPDLFFNGIDLRNIDMVINQLHNFSTSGEKERAEETKVAREPWSLKCSDYPSFFFDLITRLPIVRCTALSNF
jgi:hypothetical protein